LIEFEHLFRLGRRAGDGVFCDQGGLSVGEVALLERASDPGVAEPWRPRPAAEINRDLSRCYGLPIGIEPKIGGLQAIARALGRGDLAHAQIAALQLRIPDPPDLAKSATDAQGLAELARRLDASGLLKGDWNEDKHPRWPPGSQDSQGGRFAPADQGGDGSGSAAAPSAGAPAVPPAERSSAGSGPRSENNGAAPGDVVSRAQSLAINGVGGLKFRVMVRDETGASDIGNLGEIASSLQKLPSSILANLKNHGVQWTVVPDSVDQAFPDENLTSQQPRGWNPPGTPLAAQRDWGDVSSQYNTRHNIVVIGTPDDFHNKDGSINVTLHETGHAYDYLNGFPSRSGSFLRAYDADLPNMATDSADYYYRQPGDAGKEEVFAEGFARFYSEDKTFPEEWPNVYAYFRNFDKNIRLDGSI